jgi:protein-disulfide isomerase
MTRDQANAILLELHEIQQLLTQQVELLGNPATHATQPVRVRLAVRKDWQTLGEAKAPVTMVEFTDLECPFCRKFHAGTFPLIKTNYIDTGKVRFISLDMPMEGHRHAAKAAEATHCSGDQGKFWEMRDAILSSPKGLADESIFEEFARQFQLDMASFRSCILSNKHQQDIQRDSNEAEELQIGGTPSFVIAPSDEILLSGSLMVGAQSFPDFQLRIDGILNNIH